MEDLARTLSVSSGRAVHDETGLTGRYNFTLQVIDNPSNNPEERMYNLPIDQLGLALKPGKAPGITLVIDHIERPTPN
jgi:uncharacterized protein (TIGR03435 family)